MVATIWPGFVDAMTALLMVLMFVLTIFTVVQGVLREQITTQDDTISTQDETITDQGQVISRQERQLNELGAQVASLGQALNASQDREADLTRSLETEAERAARAEAEARDRAALRQQLDALTSLIESHGAHLADH